MMIEIGGRLEECSRSAPWGKSPCSLHYRSVAIMLTHATCVTFRAPHWSVSRFCQVFMFRKTTLFSSPCTDRDPPQSVRIFRAHIACVMMGDFRSFQLRGRYAVRFFPMFILIFSLRAFCSLFVVILVVSCFVSLPPSSSWCVCCYFSSVCCCCFGLATHSRGFRAKITNATTTTSTY